MTSQNDILGNERYIPVLDHGFVGLVDHMGSDDAICQAARVSYGAGTKSVRENRGLIRYLIRHQHWSPIEQCVVKLHIKCPIFVMRQIVRHRSAALNEYSGRYSIMSDEFYVPSSDVLKPQSASNKQGRDGDLSPRAKEHIATRLHEHYEASYHLYEDLLGTEESRNQWKHDNHSDGGPHPFGDDEYPGIARELARIVLPVANYTELYWRHDLRNLMHMLRLRLDEHAQYEVRQFMQAVYDFVQPLFPAAFEAFDDYIRLATHVSRMEGDLLRMLLRAPCSAQETMDYLLAERGSIGAFADSFGMSIREVRDFAANWGIQLAA